MAIFDPPRYASHIPLYQGAPVDEVKALVAKKEEDYYKNLDLFDNTKIALANLDLNPANEPLRQELAANVNNAIRTFAEKGDYENAGYLARRLATDVATNPNLQRALANQQEFRKWENQLNDALMKKNITPDLYQYAKNKTTFSPEMTDENGAPYVFQGYTPPNYFDVDTYLRGLVSGIQPEFWASKGITMSVDPNDPEKVLFYKHKEGQAMSKKRVADILSAALKNNPEARAYMKAMQEHTGIDDYENMVQATVEPYAAGAKYERDSSKFWLGNVNQINAMDRQHRQLMERMNLGYQYDANLAQLKGQGKGGVPFPNLSGLGIENGQRTISMNLDVNKLDAIMGFFTKMTKDPFTSYKNVDQAFENNLDEDQQMLFEMIARNNRRFDKESGTLNVNGNIQSFATTEDYLKSPEAVKYVRDYVNKYGNRAYNYKTIAVEDLPTITAKFETSDPVTANYFKDTSLKKYTEDLDGLYVMEITDEGEGKPTKATDVFTTTGKKPDKLEVRGVMGFLNPGLYMLGDEGDKFVGGVIVKNNKDGKRYVVSRNSQDMSTDVHKYGVATNKIYSAGFQMPEMKTLTTINGRNIEVRFDPYDNQGGAGNGSFTIYDPRTQQGVFLESIDAQDEDGTLLINKFLDQVFQW